MTAFATTATSRRTNRDRALEAALDLLRGHTVSADILLDEARKIEDYLDHKDEPQASNVGTSNDTARPQATNGPH